MKSFAIKLAPVESFAFARIEGGRFALNVRRQSPRTLIGAVGRRLSPTVRPRALTRPRPHHCACG
jgi:hypothetical protein